LRRRYGRRPPGETPRDPVTPSRGANAALFQTNLQVRLNEVLQENSKEANLIIV